MWFSGAAQEEKGKCMTVRVIRGNNIFIPFHNIHMEQHSEHIHKKCTLYTLTAHKNSETNLSSCFAGVGPKKSLFYFFMRRQAVEPKRMENPFGGIKQ